MGPIFLNQVQNEVFCYFLEFGALIFFEIAYSDNLQQCLAFSWVKIHEKILEPRFVPNEPKSGQKLSFLLFFQVLFISFPWIAYSDTCNNV